MTLTLNLNSEVEAGLSARAQASGMSIEQFLQSIVEGAILRTLPKVSPVEERIAAFEAWSREHRATSPLSDIAVSRKSMYERS